MSRPVQLHLQPPFYPKVCIRCGCGTGQREFFVDLGLNLTGYFNPMHEGDIYYCNECVRNLVVDIDRLLTKREEETAPWSAGADVTYSWENQVDLSGVEAEIERARVNESSHTDSESNDSGVEQVTSSTTSTVELSESTVSSIFPDDEPGTIGLFFDDDPAA